MSLVIISKRSNQLEWIKALNEFEPDLEISIYPDVSEKEKVEFALVWQPPTGVFNDFPNLKWIASTGAGVDHILRDPNLPEGIHVTRIVDKKLTEDMTSYLTAQVMAYIRNIVEYKISQVKKVWHPRAYTQESKVTVGIMGMGELGQAAATRLNLMGFRVQGWARTMKKLSGIKIFSGDEGYDEFLESTNILICLLPLTELTRDILNESAFNKLPPNAYVINVARGEHLVEADLIKAIDSGPLSGACLDVFRKEPLPPDHPFWQHPKIRVTPHIASITSPESVAPQIIENYRRFISGKALINEVSRDRGY